MFFKFNKFIALTWQNSSLYLICQQKRYFQQFVQVDNAAFLVAQDVFVRVLICLLIPKYVLGFPFPLFLYRVKYND